MRKLLVALLISVMVLWGVGDVTTQVVCDLYVAPTLQGTGDHSSEANAGLASAVWAKANGGEAVCYLDGTYTGANSMVAPTAGMSGTKAQYITIRAKNEGSVFIDGQDARIPLHLDNNRYVIVEGFNFGNSSSHTCLLSNTTCAQTCGCSDAPLIIVRRSVCFDACATCNSKVLQNDDTEYTLWEDVAAWGTGRKTVEAYQSDHTTWRRLFAVWGGGGIPEQAEVQHGLTMIYQSYNSTLENGVLSMNKVFGDFLDLHDILGFDRLDTDAQNPYWATYRNTANARIFGTLTYVLNSFTYGLTNLNRGSVWAASGNDQYTDIQLQDVVAYIQSGGPHDAKRPLRLNDHIGVGAADKFATRVSNIGQTAASVHSDWLQTNVNNYTSPITASIYTGASRANICKRYLNGILTTTNLFPWPMDSRIVAAAALPSSSMTLSQLLGTSTNVSDLFNDHFGTIPVECGG